MIYIETNAMPNTFNEKKPDIPFKIKLNMNE